MSEYKIYPKPTEIGMYWARSTRSMKWYDVIIEIWGETPYLQFRAWYRLRNELGKGVDPQGLHFGPKIEIPEMEEICPV